METIEEFFNNKTSFISVVDPFRLNTTGYISKNIFKPKDYSLDFLKEKIAPLCYYIHSDLMKNGIIEYSSNNGFNYHYRINGGYYNTEIGLSFFHHSTPVHELFFQPEKFFRF